MQHTPRHPPTKAALFLRILTNERAPAIIADRMTRGEEADGASVLRYFLTVVREENITRAAKVLHITQPTLSRQLSMLE